MKESRKDAKSIPVPREARVVIVSGIPAGDSGTGRFVAHLRGRVTELGQSKVLLIEKPEPIPRWLLEHWLRQKVYRYVIGRLRRYFLLWCKFQLALLCAAFRRSEVLLLLHPQCLGFNLSLRLLESRKHPSLIYLLDSSFFCISSYNHIKSEQAACVKCIEQGFGAIEKNGCQPFPVPDEAAVGYVKRLRDMVKTGRVRVAAQNWHQAELAKRHFDLIDLPRVVGLWTEDWDELLSFKRNTQLQMSVAEPTEYSWDVLFHGHFLSAKGAYWLTRVAESCPELRFMFPCGKPGDLVAPSNCSFVPCSWDSGLREEIKRSRIVAVPSLWSAPIEGALVKSIAYGRAVSVVENKTTFSDELPSGLLLRLPSDVVLAAEALRLACRNGWRPDAVVRERWLSALIYKRERVVSDLLGLCFESSSIGRNADK